MSSMRSASSMTRISMPVSNSLPRSKWSSRRPGVAMRTSTPRVILASWSPKETPPMRRATLRRCWTPYLLKLSSTCAASSRVGSRMSVRGIRARARPCSSSVSIGSVNAAVLPVRSGRCRERRGAPAHGNGLSLNRRRRRVSGGRNRLEDLLAQSEIAEVHLLRPPSAAAIDALSREGKGSRMRRVDDNRRPDLRSLAAT